MTENSKLRRISWTRFGRVFLLFVLLAFAAGAQDLSCPAVNPPNGRDFRGETIIRGNFSYRDLTNADFSNATLIAPYFAYANLKNANFQGATFVGDDTNPAMVSDFSFANLERACFIGTRFEVPSYFTRATLTCADFSRVDLSNQNVIFRNDRLTFDRDRQDCRLAFRSAVMDCEFVSDWRYLDLAGADIKACASQLDGKDFSGAKLNDVNLAGANLNGSKFVRANLNRTNLREATLIGADLSYATLLGARLNSANLTNASLYHAFLSNDTAEGISNAASLSQAHLKNVNLSYAQLSGVDFTHANLYGTDPADSGTCKTALSIGQCSGPGSGNYQGFACRCASAHGATMRQTNFSDAYLYGLDLTSAQIQSGNFTRAVLTGANLNGASISTDPQSGAPSNFFRAFLQGTTLDGAKFGDESNLLDAFVDFFEDGNSIYILLDGDNHNHFACSDCSPPTGSPVCVVVNYHEPTSVPATNVPLVCPNDHHGNCGPATPDGSNKAWQSRITNLASPPGGVPPAWYHLDSTYIKAPANRSSICNGRAPTFFW